MQPTQLNQPHKHEDGSNSWKSWTELIYQQCKNELSFINIFTSLILCVCQKIELIQKQTIRLDIKRDFKSSFI